MEKIKLNFINRSKDTNNSNIVIFQKNAADNFGEVAVAWKVIQNCGSLHNHPFTYSMNMQVSASDSYGNYTPQQNAFEGQVFEMINNSTGHLLQLSSNTAQIPRETEVVNELEMGAITANCYRDGKLLATKTGLAPGQRAFFEFRPVIYIGVVYRVEQGDIMTSATISQVNTEINLFGIASADIVMTGGGSGPSATRLIFTLENIQNA